MPPARYRRDNAMRLRDPSLFRRILTTQNLSYRQLEERSGVSRPTIAKLCTGRQALCSPVVANALAEALGVRRETLFSLSVSTKMASHVPNKKTVGE